MVCALPSVVMRDGRCTIVALAWVAACGSPSEATPNEEPAIAEVRPQGDIAPRAPSLGAAPCQGDACTPRFSECRTAADAISTDAALVAALAIAERGTTIHLAPGVYRADLALPEGVAIEGACAAQTILEATSASEDEGVITALGDARVSRLTIRGARPAIWAGPMPGTVRLEEVRVEGAGERTAVLALGLGAVEGRDVAVRGQGALAAIEGGRIELERAAIEGSAISSGFGSRVALGSFVIGSATVEEGAELELRVGTSHAIRSIGAGARAVIAEVHIADGLEPAIEVSGAARIAASRVTFGSNGTVLAAIGRGSRVELADGVLSGGELHAAVAIEGGATTRMERIAITSASPEHAVGAFGAGTRLELDDVSIVHAPSARAIIGDAEIQRTRTREEVSPRRQASVATTTAPRGG